MLLVCVEFDEIPLLCKLNELNLLICEASSFSIDLANTAMYQAVLQRFSVQM